MASEIKVDTVSEKTSGSGVTIDGLLIKDGGISGDVSLIGTTPTFTIGDAGAEDAALVFDGNAQDFYIGLDDSADDLIIGHGSTVGTNPAISIDENQNVNIAQNLSLDTDGDSYIKSPSDDLVHFFIGAGTGGSTNDARFEFDGTQFRTQRVGTNQIKIANIRGEATEKSGEIFFIGKDSAGLETNFSKIGGGYVTTTNGSEDGQLVFTVINSATETDSLTINQTGSKFNVGAYHPEVALTDASTISWNVYTSPVAKVTLGANRTLGAATNAQTGQFISLLIIQDGTGSRTVTFNAAYEFKDDTAPTLTTTAAKGDLFVFRYNGSKFLEVGRNLNLTLS